MKLIRIFSDIQILLTAICGIFLVLCFFPIHPAMAYISVAAGSYFAIKSGVDSLRERSLDVNFLMILAAVGAVVVGHVEDAAALLFLFSLSSTLEALAMSRTKSAIESLIRLRPEKAIRVGATDESVGVAELRLEDTVRVLPFEQIPIDGFLISDNASISEASITGESRSISKQSGDPLISGTQNLDSMLIMRVSAVVGDTTLDRMVSLVGEAQNNKASGERISQWFGQRYTIAVFVIFGLSFLIRLGLGAASGSALYSSLILLVALSPCALVISTPAATLSALAFAARRGILVRGGQFIEEAGKIDFAAVDKTGTLTKGEPHLVEICLEATTNALVPAGNHPEPGMIVCWHDGASMPEPTLAALRFAAAAEAFSTHPIAEAIVRAAHGAGIDVPVATASQAVPGQGVTATIDGQTIKIGQVKYFEGPEDALPDDFREHVAEMRARGLTSVLMRMPDGWAAMGMEDTMREETPAFLDALRASGVKTIAMLTGDNLATAQAVASVVKLDEVHAGLMPEDKDRLLEGWIKAGRRVMMIGDGVNDAPALARAHMGVAMGGLGSDVAMNAADVVLVQDRIGRLPELLHLGRLSNRIIRTNLIFAAGMIVTLTILSFVWPLIPALTHLSPAMPLPLAVIGHEGSTVIVILNGLRLLNGAGR